MKTTIRDASEAMELALLAAETDTLFPKEEGMSDEEHMARRRLFAKMRVLASQVFGQWLVETGIARDETVDPALLRHLWVAAGKVARRS